MMSCDVYIGMAERLKILEKTNSKKIRKISVDNYGKYMKISKKSKSSMGSGFQLFKRQQSPVIEVLKQPPVITIDGWYKPFPVMGGL